MKYGFHNCVLDTARFTLYRDGETDTVIARGLVHDVTTRIARSRTMFIIARGTAFQFQSGDNDVSEVGANLGIRYVVHGAAQLSDNKLRITIALASMETCQEPSSWQYDRTLGAEPR